MTTSKFNVSAIEFKESRKELFQLAEAARAVGRNDDAYYSAKALVTGIDPGQFTAEECALFCAASIEVIAARRNAVRELDAEAHKGKNFIPSYRQQLFQEFEEVSNDALRTLEVSLLPPVKNGHAEMQVLIQNHIGTIAGLLAEFNPDTHYRGKAEEAYEQATRIGEQALPCTDPAFLNMVQNRAVFTHTVSKDNEKACEIVKKAFDEAISKLDHLDKDSYHKVSKILMILQEKLLTWSGEIQGARLD